MTRYFIYSDAVGFDGELKNASTNYNNSRNGTGTFTTVAVADGWGLIGQGLSGTTYTSYLMYFQFDLTAVQSDDLIVSSFFNFFNRGTTGSAARDIEIREYDFGASLTNADWRTPAQFTALPYYGQVRYVQQSANGVTGLRGGSAALNDRIATGSNTLRVVAATNRWRSGNAPTTSNPNEYNSVYHSSQAGTVNDPMLVVETVKQHSLVHVGGQGCIQLRNGNHFYLEFNGSTVSPAIVGKYHNGTSASIVVTLSLVQSFDADYYALQRYAICADANDNIYIFGPNGDDVNRLSGKALVKNLAGYTWVEKQTISFDLPAYYNVGSSYINNIVAVWQATGGAGSCMVAASHMAWTDDNAMMTYAVTSCSAMQAGAGTLVTKSGNLNAIIDFTTSTELIAYSNETGTGLDIVTRGSFPGANTKGNIITYDSDNRAKFSSYTNTGPTTIQGTELFSTIFNTPIIKEPNSKARMVPIDYNRYVAIAGDYFAVYLWDGGFLADGFLSDAGPASVLTSSQFQTTTDWDVVYDPASTKLFVYYIDFADSNRLMRTSYDMSAYAWTGEEKEVDAAIGGVGSTNFSVRCPRQWIYGRRVQVAVSNLDTGVHTTIYNYDSINVAPTAPTKNTRDPFDSDDPATFSWVFNDANQTDAQSAYQLQIYDATGTTSIYDSGKVSSSATQHVLPAATIANNTTFQWRVRTYDIDDVVSNYALFTTFNTSNAAIVTITFPATDNEPDYQNAEVPLQWSVTGAPQDEYRVKVVVVQDGSTFSDTGFLVGTQGVRTITGLASGVQYRFEVTVKSASVSSNTATRLLTPDYASPEVPFITVTPIDDGGYMQILVVNPPPDGDRPDADKNLIRRINDEDPTDDRYIAYSDPNSEYRDYAAAAGISYTYIVYAQSPDGYQATSASGSGTLRFQGVWIHDPDDPQGTVRQYLYGKDARGDSLEVSQTAVKFAGRTSPVYYFGEQEDSSMSVKVDFPYNEWRTGTESIKTFIRKRKALCVRENRGRKLFGILTGYRNDDADIGSTVTFAVNKVDYSEDIL